MTLEFDIFTYDFGKDGLPGDPFEDIQGDSKFQMGECLGIGGSFVPNSLCDSGSGSFVRVLHNVSLARKKNSPHTLFPQNHRFQQDVYYSFLFASVKFFLL